ncbi:cob(I)yrinic acid a,c-diamide adenosyltransferase [Candidatus Woesearchaeota archaeon]|nr:cob(I)yrinic acid a,c-diamide adenosyltransferase [Candidatus Woesearchaeota archaeon]
MIYLWTGAGYGKSTSAFGVAIRALGHGKKVIIVQFMKGRKNIGEYKIFSRMKNIKIKQFGSPRFVNLNHPGKSDKKRAQSGLEYVKEAIKEKPFLLILDEINLAAAIKLMETREVLEILKTAPKSINIYLTGRKAPEAFIKKADFVNIIECRKKKVIKARAGIEY